METITNQEPSNNTPVTDKPLRKSFDEINDHTSTKSDEKSQSANLDQPQANVQPVENQVNEPSSPDNAENSHPSSIKEAEDLLKELKEDYTEHKLEQAYRLKHKLLEIRDSLPTHDVQAYHDLLAAESDLFKTIDEQYEYLQTILADLNTEEGWTKDVIDSKSKIYYKLGSNGLSTNRIEAEISVPVVHLMAMINEIELWPLWNAFMGKTEEIKYVSRNARVFYIDYGLPYPLANRNLYLYGVGLNRLYEDGTILMMAQSIDQNEEFLERQQIKKFENSGAVNITIHVGGFEVTPLDRERCILRGVANIDPKFNWVPRSILNWALKKGTKEMVDKIIAGARNFKGSPWEKQIQSEGKREFYEWLNNRLEEYHRTREESKAQAQV